MEDTLFQQFRRLIALHAGLDIPERDGQRFSETTSGRVRSLKLSTPERYYQFLETDTAESRVEWEGLMAQLTVGESYFFRDEGQFALLRNSVLPELIERNIRRRSLRIWSAGCSSGEEPYSLAVLVSEALGGRGDWKVVILGTDINREALEKARRGVYSEWSFRMVEPGLRVRYFHRRGDEWELDMRIREMVTFRSMNILKDPFPDLASDLHSLDLILCRNVFIYFDRDAVSPVLRKFEETLHEGGYLITGHGELHGQKLGRLRTRVFSESVVYQRIP
ncbi:MAG: chemotaxis protein CheR [Candidatus Latescibacteria bacterium]|nr:chemotaxis protein CheR [Candidatus Latescibacterota bacterium]